eukprot:gene15313-biopygen6261
MGVPYTEHPSDGRHRCGAATAKELGNEGAAIAKVRSDEGEEVDRLLAVGDVTAPAFRRSDDGEGGERRRHPSDGCAGGAWRRWSRCAPEPDRGARNRGDHAQDVDELQGYIRRNPRPRLFATTKEWNGEGKRRKGRDDDGEGEERRTRRSRAAEARIGWAMVKELGDDERNGGAKQARDGAEKAKGKQRGDDDEG